MARLERHSYQLSPKRYSSTDLKPVQVGLIGERENIKDQVLFKFAIY
jgi:hypothetical protein